LVDPESIDARLEHLADLLEEAERIRADGRAAYDAGLRDRLATQHAIQLAIQICVDIGAHLIAEFGLRMPDDYKGVFEALREPLELDTELVAGLSSAAGMRNVLVHVYLEVDDDEVWDALGHLDDLRKFAAAAERVAASEGDRGGSQDD
jgi:uncharacterized protein YutE (UPF0331/DUF86 family)